MGIVAEKVNPLVPTESTLDLEDLNDDELLIEEISIDGMCGVY